MQRKQVSRLLAELDERYPGARRNMLAALGNVRPSHLFDSGLWKKLGLEVAREGEGSARELGLDGDGELIASDRLLGHTRHTRHPT